MSKSNKKLPVKNLVDEQKYVMAKLEVDEIDWDNEENTPEFACYQNENVEQERVSLKLISPKEKRREREIEEKRFTNVRDKSDKIRRTISETDPYFIDEDAVESENCFSLLADEIILKIFSYLSHKSIAKSVIVCKRWKKLGYDTVLWKKVNLQERHIEYPFLRQILHRGVYVLNLNQAEIFPSSDANSSEEYQDRFQLTHLNSTMSKFSSDILKSLLVKCYNLLKLSLEGCKLGLPECAAISNNENLQTLNLSVVTGLSHAGLDILTKKCTKIKSLSIAWTGLKSDSMKLICRCKQLEELNVSGLIGGVVKKMMEKLLQSCPFLVSIDLSDVKLEFGMLRLILNRCSKLQKLSMSRCVDVNSDQLMQAVELKSLTHLNLYGFVNIDTLKMFSKARPDIALNCEPFSTTSRPISAAGFNGYIWDEFVGLAD